MQRPATEAAVQYHDAADRSAPTDDVTYRRERQSRVLQQVKIGGWTSKHKVAFGSYEAVAREVEKEGVARPAGLLGERVDQLSVLDLIKQDRVTVRRQSPRGWVG